MRRTRETALAFLLSSAFRAQFRLFTPDRFWSARSLRLADRAFHRFAGYRSFRQV